MTIGPALRMLTKEECAENAAKANEALLIYIKEEAPIDKRHKAEADKAIWERIIEHLDNGEIITIDEETRIHWVQSASKNN